MAEPVKRISEAVFKCSLEIFTVLLETASNSKEVKGKLLYTMTEVADMLSVSVSTVKRLIESGRLKPVYPFKTKQNLGERRFTYRALERLIRELEEEER